MIWFIVFKFNVKCIKPYFTFLKVKPSAMRGGGGGHSPIEILVGVSLGRTVILIGRQKYFLTTYM